MRSWLEFLMDVLAIQRIDFSLTTPLDSRNLDIEGLTRVLEGIDIRLLAVDFSSATPRFDELASKLFWANLPSANQVLIRNCLYRDSQDYQKVFIQNLDRLVLKPTLLFTLEDLLSCGSSCIKIPNTSPFTDKDFNLFMKHWIRGSNPNLEYLTINATTDLREHFMTYWYLLKGINFHDGPGPGALRGTYRINGHSGSYHWKHEKIVELKGGVDVENADGTIATIVLWYDEVEVQHLTFEMRVWRAPVKMADFLLQHEFEYVDGLEDNASLTGNSESFGDFKWTLGITRSEDSLWLSLECSSKKNVEQVKTNLKLILISLNGNRWAKQFDGSCFKFDKSEVDRKIERIVGWESIENDFLVDGKIKVQAHLGGLEVEESGVGERIHLMRRDDYIGVGITWRQKFGQDFRKLRAEIDLVISSENGNRFAKKLKDAVFESKIYGQYCIQGKEIFDWESVGDFLVDGALKVEARVNVIDSVLIPKQQTLKGDKLEEIEDFESKLKVLDNLINENSGAGTLDASGINDDKPEELEDFESKLRIPDNLINENSKAGSIIDIGVRSKFGRSTTVQKRIKDLDTRNKDLSSDIGTLGDVVKQLTLMNEKMEKEADQRAEVNMERELKSVSFWSGKMSEIVEKCRKMSKNVGEMSINAKKCAKNVKNALKSKQQLKNDTLKSPAITDENVNTKLRSATEQEDLITIYQCEEFLTSKSKKSTSEMLRIAMEFNLDNLKNHCLSNMTTSEQIAEIVSDLKLGGLDRPLLEALITRALELKS
nr:protein M01D1.2 [imported] - Caenorhabditis elegans [Caenorhabditis elegans]